MKDEWTSEGRKGGRKREERNTDSFIGLRNGHVRFLVEHFCARHAFH